MKAFLTSALGIVTLPLSESLACFIFGDNGCVLLSQGCLPGSAVCRFLSLIPLSVLVVPPDFPSTLAILCPMPMSPRKPPSVFFWNEVGSINQSLKDGPVLCPRSRCVHCQLQTCAHFPSHCVPRCSLGAELWARACTVLWQPQGTEGKIGTLGRRPASGGTTCTCSLVKGEGSNFPSKIKTLQLYGIQKNKNGFLN